MTDGIIKGSGNSRFFRGPANMMTLYPTYEAFAAAVAAGTFPFDLNGINPAGWERVGDKLDKSTLLTDALCSDLGLPATATPTQAMEKIRLISEEKASFVTGSYVGTGNYGEDHPNSLTFPFKPKYILMFNSNGNPLVGNYLSLSYDSQKGGLTDALSTEYKENICFATFSGSTSANIYTKVKISGNGKTITWYSYYYRTNQGVQDSSVDQMNALNVIYRYLAIG